MLGAPYWAQKLNVWLSACVVFSFVVFSVCWNCSLKFCLRQRCRVRWLLWTVRKGWEKQVHYKQRRADSDHAVVRIQPNFRRTRLLLRSIRERFVNNHSIQQYGTRKLGLVSGADPTFGRVGPPVGWGGTQHDEKTPSRRISGPGVAIYFWIHCQGGSLKHRTDRTHRLLRIAFSPCSRHTQQRSHTNFCSLSYTHEMGIFSVFLQKQSVLWWTTVFEQSLSARSFFVQGRRVTSLMQRKRVVSQRSILVLQMAGSTSGLSWSWCTSIRKWRSVSKTFLPHLRPMTKVAMEKFPQANLFTFCPTLGRSWVVLKVRQTLWTPSFTLKIQCEFACVFCPCQRTRESGPSVKQKLLQARVQELTQDFPLCLFAVERLFQEANIPMRGEVPYEPIIQTLLTPMPDYGHGLYK